MSAPVARPRSLRHVATSGTRLALDCARNIHAAVDRRMPEASALASWLAQSAAAFGLSEADIPGDPDDLGRSRRRGVAASDWRKIDTALEMAADALPPAFDAPVDRWIAAIAEALELDPSAGRILALALHYKLDQRVGRLFDAMSECRGGITRFTRDAGLIAMLLQDSTAEVASQLAGGAKLLASGLLQLDQRGCLSVLSRLKALIRQDVSPTANFYDQLLGATEAEPLPWEAFVHLGQEAEVAVAVLRAALAGKESGVSILLYGPPGTCNTSA